MLLPTFGAWAGALPVETRRLVLRAPVFDDVPRIALYAGDPRVARMVAAVPHPCSQAHASAFVGDMIATNQSGTGLALAVARHREPAALVGLISFTLQTPATATIGWWFGPPYWGRGFATEAVEAAIRLAFLNPAVDRLTAGAFADNPASLRVQDKLGFARAGVSERNSLARGGMVAHVDTVLTRPGFAAR
ncbi:MAG: GNAT family N-acetyltransferase [Phreatobacter sp.]